MFGPVSMNQRRIRPPQGAYRRDPYMMQARSQMPPNRAAMNINRFLPAGSEKSFTLNKGMNGVTKFLDNAQQVLKMVETTTPLIKEYVPMIKNLPAMYRMIKAFKDIEGFTETEEGKAEGEGVASSHNNTVQKEEKEPAMKETAAVSKSEGISIPKLYI